MNYYIFLVVFAFSDLFADAVELRIVPKSKYLMQRKVAANFPFDPPIQVEAVDETWKRIETGFYSQLNISALLTNSSGCVSVGAEFQLQAGIGTFSGSICSPISSIAINFTSTWNGTTFWSDSTPNIEVTGEIHVAHFKEQQTELSDGLNAFVFGSVADINEGMTQQDSNQQPLLPDRVIYVRNYVHGGTEDGAIESYLEMKRNIELDPASKPHAVLGFGSNVASDMLLPVAMLDDFSVLSYANDSLAKFSDKIKYPFFNRLLYSESSKYHGFVLYLLERKWKDIVLLQSADSLLEKEFFDMCDVYKINILYQVTFPIISDFNREPAGGFKNHFAKIRTVGSKIIVTAAKKPTSYYLFCEASSQNVTAKHGYQWVGFETEDDFPHGNEPTRCQDMNNLCNFAFKGTTFVSSIYIINAYSTPQWSQIWKRYLDIDPSQEKEIAAELWKHGSSYALAYDSVQLYAAAFKELIQANKTITGPLLSSTIRSIQMKNGLLENASLSKTGDPTRFAARVSLVWPNEGIWKNFFSLKVQAGILEPWDWSLAKKYSNPTNGYFIVESPQSNSTVNIKSDGGSNMLYTVDWMKDAALRTGYINVDPKYKNLRRYRSMVGLFSLDEQKLVAEDWSFENRDFREGVGYQEIERTEYIPAPFCCESGCGGMQTDPENILLYEHGICSRQNVCTCHLDANGSRLWRGERCHIPICNNGCFNGNCTSPNICDCSLGWNGSDCGTPICNNSFPCDDIGGICIHPNECVCKADFYGVSCSRKCTCQKGKCKHGQNGDGTCITCDTGYFGENCDISLYAVIFPVIFGAVLFLILVLSAIKCFVRRTKLQTELQSNDWIVQWSDLKRSSDKAAKNMFLTRISLDDENRQKKTNIGTWQRIDVHYQRFDRPSLKLTESLRYEIKIIREMKHENLLRFVGACLESPNILVLTELAAKGSLDDVLFNEDIKMPWIFKYSLLKDICRGLEYIHQSEIGSHGRLKSSNCLIDSRWTLKLSGFGLKSFREDQINVDEFHPGQEIPSRTGDQIESDFFELLWTAPEILKTGVYHIDHVGYGTMEGDVYSFAMVFSEICNRETPFSNLCLSNSKIIDLISGRVNPFLQRTWNTYLASMNMEAGGPVKPCIPQSKWPSKKEQSKPLKLLINRCWIRDPSLRPIPKDILRNLEKIDPDHGENVEKLVSMKILEARSPITKSLSNYCFVAEALEQYSNNLEDVVTARAQALANEKRKTNELVARLLPRPIVEDLKLGKPVEAEKFECVSICYSDFYEFSAISGASTPEQVITLLNQIYCCFDSVLLKFDAFKIETIGNTYMVVAGLPVRNGKKHATEIAMFSLALIDAVRDFKIEHLPDNSFKLRIGIHSGGVAAGVVGLKMPRYCVFGESVGIASAMESTGKPMKIHISNKTVELIENSSAFKLEYHRRQDFKAYGLMKTWWLSPGQGAKRVLVNPQEQKLFDNGNCKE